MLGLALEAVRNHAFTGSAIIHLIGRSPALWILVLLPMLAQVIVPAPVQPDIAKIIGEEDEEDRIEDLSSFLSQATSRARELFEGLPVACCTFDISGHVLEWNKACEQMFGVTAPHVLDRPLSAVEVLKQNSASIGAAMQRIQKDEMVDGLEWSVITTTGFVHTCLAFLYPLHGLDGSVVGGTCVLLDVTGLRAAEDALVATRREFDSLLEQRTIALSNTNAGLIDKVELLLTTQKALRDTEQQAQFLADSMPLIVWIAKPDGGVHYFNSAWFEYTGLTLEESKDWVWKSVIHADDLFKCVDKWLASISTGEPFEAEYRFKRRVDGAYRWHLGRATPMRDDAGDVQFWVGTCTDIDDQKRTQQQLELAHTDLERRVAERTAELARANETLLDEIEIRQSAELALKASESRFHALADNPASPPDQKAA